MTEPIQRVTIVGAGICGLACAYRLGQLGIPATVLESSRHPGGVIDSEETRRLSVRVGTAKFFGRRTVAHARPRTWPRVRTANRRSQGAALHRKRQASPKDSHVAASDVGDRPSSARALVGSSPPSLGGKRKPPADDESIAQFRASQIRQRNTRISGRALRFGRLCGRSGTIESSRRISSGRPMGTRTRQRSARRHEIASQGRSEGPPTAALLLS